MNYVVTNPSKIYVYQQTYPYKTMSQIKTAKACDVIVNFQLYDMRTFNAAFCLKVDGKVLSNDGADYWGYAWNNADKTFVLGRRLQIMNKYDNFAGSVLVAKDGKAVANPEFAGNFPGVRGRTCIGRKANGDIVIYCWQDGSSGAVSIYNLGYKMIALGCVDAINFDGGGSCQMMCPDGKLYASRVVGNFLCFNLNKPTVIAESTNSSTTATTPAVNTPKKAVCPYSEPSSNIYYGNKGTAVKWMQWHLNQNGSSLTVDGEYGPKTYTALKNFQKAHSLTVDGICGKLTRAELKKF